MSIIINVNLEKLRKFKLKPRKLRAQWTVETKEPTLYDAFYNGIEYSEDYSDSYVDRKLPDRISHHQL